MRANWLQAQLETLRVQLHPHFLFNTLNTISAFVGSRPEEARDLIAQLAALLRDSIEGAGGEFYPLRREVELANRYLRIVSARFGTRLKPTLHLPPGLEEYPVPRGLLLTLLENAVTHGVSLITSDSELSLRCGVDGELLLVEVGNRYDPRAPFLPAHRGGLAALAARLNALYGDAFTLEYGGNSDGTWYTRVKLPSDCVPARTLAQPIALA
jgi:two-component system sensor histidine kinase AlgZ